MPIVTMYSTHTCPFCQRAEQLLRRKGVDDLVKINIDNSSLERDAMVARTDQRSVPQIFIGETHAGGYDQLSALDRAGQLDLLLAQ